MQQRHSGGLLHGNPQSRLKIPRQTGNLSQFLTAVRPPMQTSFHFAFTNCSVAVRTFMRTNFTLNNSALRRSGFKFPKVAGFGGAAWWQECMFSIKSPCDSTPLDQPLCRNGLGECLL